MTLLADSKDPDQTLRMRRLIWVFAVCICPKTRFRIARPMYTEKIVSYNLPMDYFNYFVIVAVFSCEIAKAVKGILSTSLR